LLPIVMQAASLMITGPPVAPPNTTVTLTVSLVSGGGPAALQWDMSGLPAGAAVSSSVPGKGVTCSPTVSRCLLYASPLSAANAAAQIPDGAIASVTFTQPAAGITLSVPSGSTLAASAAGLSVALTAPPTGTAVPPQSNCDVNGDGKIDATDLGIVVQQALSATVANLIPSIVDLQKEIIAVEGGQCLR
jgi:hypothetical protein